MSQPRGFGLNGRAIYENVTYPSIVNLNFVVDHANGNGLGIRSLKSNGYVQNVFMNTSSTPGVNNGQTNPNPIAGIAMIQLKNNFNTYLGGVSGFVSPLSGSATATLTAGHAYVIVSLGASTLAQWQAAGLPVGFTPAVGAAFIAKANIAGGGMCEAPTASGIMSIEVVGDPNQTISGFPIATAAGAYLIVQFLNTSGAQTAPADGTVVGLQIKMDRGTVQIPDSPGQTGI